jgi:hypothetical protein
LGCLLVPSVLFVLLVLLQLGEVLLADVFSVVPVLALSLVVTRISDYDIKIIKEGQHHSNASLSLDLNGPVYQGIKLKHWKCAGLHGFRQACRGCFKKRIQDCLGSHVASMRQYFSSGWKRINSTYSIFSAAVVGCDLEVCIIVPQVDQEWGSRKWAAAGVEVKGHCYAGRVFGSNLFHFLAVLDGESDAATRT